MLHKHIKFGGKLVNRTSILLVLVNFDKVWYDVQAHDDTQCGFAYSTADQVAYCSVMEPPIWPALLQLPEDQYAGDAPQALNASENALNISSAPLLYTGNDRATADALMSALFAREQPVGEAVVNCNYCTRQQSRTAN